MTEEQKQKKFKEEKEKRPDEPKLAISEIYVMPEKFRPQAKKGTSGKTVFIISILVVVSLLVAGAVVLFTTNLGKEQALVQTSENVPLNVKVPVNTPANANVNTPKNVPANANKPLKAKEQLNTPLNVNAPGQSILSTPQQLPSSLDTDKDNLTDIEEALYGTDVNKPDTDSDSYTDGLEVVNLYNPAGIAPVRLKDSGIISVYKNPVFDYQIFYPRGWTIRSIDETNKEVIFSSTTREFIQVIIEKNPEKLTALDWYLGQSPRVDPKSIGSADNDFFKGIKSPDGLTVYLVPQNKKSDIIYIITYNAGTRTELNFKTTFEMMINSFKPKG